MKNLENWSKRIVRALETEDETGDTFLMLDVIDADSVLDLITRCQAAESALNMACEILSCSGFVSHGGSKETEDIRDGFMSVTRGLIK